MALHMRESTLAKERLSKQGSTCGGGALGALVSQQHVAQLGVHVLRVPLRLSTSFSQIQTLFLKQLSSKFLKSNL